MKKILFLILLSLIGLSFIKSEGYFELLSYPSYWPTPTYNFKKKPLSKLKIELGRKLFYEPMLSKDNTISCASCHLSFSSFTHTDHALSHGIDDRIGKRNSPVLVNLAWNTSFMWDGAVNHIDVQALAPISHPDEMGEELNNVIKKLQGDKRYPRMFETAFGDSIITGEHLLLSIAQFQLTLVSCNSKYDQVIAGENRFNEQEERGYQLFQKHCASCHQEPLFTNGNFERNGLPIDSNLMDVGRCGITNVASDSMKFKVPTLRNIQFSKPYMHDGRFSSLNDVIKHYNTYLFTSNNRKGLTETERIDIIAFLRTLSDRTFMFNPKFQYPR